VQADVPVYGLDQLCRIETDPVLEDPGYLLDVGYLLNWISIQDHKRLTYPNALGSIVIVNKAHPIDAIKH